MIMADKSLETAFVEAFDRKVGLLGNGSSDAWLTSRRRAIKVFADTGFPGKKSESYKYTPVRKWMKDGPTLDATRPETGPVPPFGSFEGIHVSTMNGSLLDEHVEGLPAGVTIMGLRTAYEQNPVFVRDYMSRIADIERDSFTALAAAFADDGILVHISAGTVVEKPIYVHHVGLSANGFIQPRMLIVAEENSQAHIIEHFGAAGAGTTFENRMVEVSVARRANLRHVVVYERERDARFVNGLHVHQAEESVFATNHITLGGGMVRHNLNFLPDAEHCETHLNGLYIARDGAHIDNHTLVDHAKPNCFSNELFKGIISDTSTGVFNGKVLVRQDAQKINAYQSSKSILLDKTAHIYAKPELEIYADDVKCSHGATTGMLDEDALFYLMARGIPKARARVMLLEAFARDVVDLITVEPVKDYLNSRLHEILAQ